MGSGEHKEDAVFRMFDGRRNMLLPTYVKIAMKYEGSHSYHDPVRPHKFRAVLGIYGLLRPQGKVFSVDRLDIARVVLN